jgi:uncharacterized protein YjiS (DUF1127 family)
MPPRTRTDLALPLDLRPQDALHRALAWLVRLDAGYQERAALREMPAERLRDIGLRRAGRRIVQL